MTNIFPTDFAEKTTPADNDVILLADSADSSKIKYGKYSAFKGTTGANGTDGDDGNGIASITTNKVGKTTTVTITEDDSTVTAFDLEDGADGIGAGDVMGPATNTADYIPQWDGANSKTLKDGLAVPAGGLAGLTALGTKLDSSAFSDAGVTGKLITGYSSGAGTVAGTDTILQAINKLNGNTDAKITTGAGNADSSVSDASTTVKGKVELAINTEVNTGTSDTLAVTPDALAGSYAGTKGFTVIAVDAATSLTVADGKAYIAIPECMNGMLLVRANAIVNTAGTTNATTIDIYNVTDSHDMLSTAISIASAGTVGTAGTVDASYDDVATNDVLRIDVTSMSTTAPKGLIVVLEFRLA